ncbi:MAG: tripartite tricarboxylate transporter substrate binding protein [Rubrivivax sp.]|nr:tripartite tricarboxylate transporter substrate binding protein [Rubrivivax sp.]
MNPIDRRQVLKALLGTTSVLAAPGLLHAQDRYPNKLVTLVVPQPAGGGADALCRSLQGELQKALGQSVIIDNKGGAAGNIGTAAGLAAPADGYTVTFVNLSTMALNPHLYAKTGYSVADMQPVILLTSVANIIAVNPDKVPSKTLPEFLELVRKNPGKYTYATAGNGSGNHLGGEMLKSMAKIDLLHVPYKGGGPALTALLGGEVDAAVADPLATLPHIKSGKLRALAVTSAKRASALPDVPTVAESGVPGYEAASWAGIVVPKATPAPVVDALYKAFDKALKAPEVSSRLSSQLYEPVGMGPKEFARFAAAENEKWGKLIKQLNVKLD